MSSTDARVRGSWASRLLVAIEEAHPGARGDILGRLPEEIGRQYDRGTSVGWIPMEHHMLVVRQVAAVVGVPSLDAVQRSNFSNGFGRSAIGRLVVPGVRLFGASGTALCSLVPRVYSFMTRDSGTIRTSFRERGQGVGLEMTDMPQCCRSDDLYPRAFRNAMWACLDLVETTGNVDMDVTELTGGRVRYHVTVEDAQTLARRRRTI